MVWYEHIHRVLMITMLVEGGKVRVCYADIFALFLICFQFVLICFIFTCLQSTLSVYDEF